MVRYPAVGFKLTDENGITVSRFQVTFEDNKVYNDFVDFLAQHNLTVNKVTKETSSQSPTLPSQFILPSQIQKRNEIVNLNPQKSKESTTSYFSSKAQYEPNLPTQLESIDYSNFDINADFTQSQVLPSQITNFSHTSPAYFGNELTTFRANTYTKYADVTPNTSIMSQIQDEILNVKPGKVDKGIQTKRKVNKQLTDFKRMNKTQIKDYIKELLSDEEFVKSIELLENALFGN